MIEKYIKKNSLILLLFIILFDFYFMYVAWGPLPPRNYLSLFVSMFAVIDLVKNSEWKKYRLAIIISVYPLLYYFMGIIFYNNLNFLDPKDILKYGTLSFSLIYLLNEVEKYNVSKIVVIITFVSMIVANLQLYIPKIGWLIRFLIEAKTQSTINGATARPAGLAYYTLTLSEQIIIFFPCALLLINHNINKLSLRIMTIILLVAMIFPINNRGLNLSIFISVFIIYFDGIKRNLKISVFIFSTLIMVSVFMNYFYGIRFLNFEKGNDTARIDVLILSVKIIKENFLWGIGRDYQNILTIIKEYGSRYGVVFGDFFGTIYPHNYIINIHLKFGLIGSYVNLTLIKEFISTNNYGLAIMLCLIFNSLFHNGGFLNSSTIMIGYFISTIIFKKEEKNA